MTIPADLKPLRPAAAKRYRRNRYSLADGWEIEVKEDRDVRAIEVGEPEGERGLISLSKRKSTGPCRILRRLDLPPGLARMSIAFACRASPGDVLEWAAVLEELPNGHRQFVAKSEAHGPGGLAKRRNSSRRAGLLERLGIGPARVDPLDAEPSVHAIRLNARDLSGKGRLFLAFECSPSPGRLIVSDLAVETIASDDLAGDASSEAYPAGAAGMKAEALSAIGRLSAEIPTPYYRRLAGAVGHCRDERHLFEALRTLRSIDLPRRGTIPRVEGPLVSVVMPVFNRAKIVGEAVRSVLAQTYRSIELLVCDDASGDDTAEAVSAVADSRVRLLSHPVNQGAAAARNTCLAAAAGRYVAYLDSDNLWHPRYLELMVEELARSPGSVAAYASHFDIESVEAGEPGFRHVDIIPYDLETQIDRPFIDLNSFVHRRELKDVFGGFDVGLTRRQDYDLVARYCWVHEPRHVQFALNLYIRDKQLGQITKSGDPRQAALTRARAKVDGFYANGVPAEFPPWLNRITVLSWDMSRNHFGKAWSVAEALSRRFDVRLVSFRFFAEEVYQPYSGAKPPFELVSFPGGDFPDFFKTMERAVEAIDGDLIYAIKPRLPSFGLALLANHRTGTPVFLEANDLETVVGAPSRGDTHQSLPLSALIADRDAARSPYGDVWSQVLDRCVAEMPIVYTHNQNLDIHYGRRCLTMRNVKDETVFDAAKIDRAAIRGELGLAENDRVILFGGTVRAHKGAFELAEFVGRLGPSYKLLIAGSRPTAELKRLENDASGRVIVLPPQPAARMAAINRAADLVVLWLDPAVPASAYQNPYKLTDALAMGVPVVATPIGELARLSERELVWDVPFGDFDALAKTVERICRGGDEVARRNAAGRRLFLREYSYNSVIAALALGVGLLEDRSVRYPLAGQLAAILSELGKR